MLGERLALGAVAYKSAYRRRPRDSPFRREFVFGRVGFQLLECQRQLVDQPKVQDFNMPGCCVSLTTSIFCAALTAAGGQRR